MILLAGSCLMGLASCGDDDPETPPTGPNPPETPVAPSEKDAMSPAKQKAYIETVARSFMNEMPSSDFKELASLGTYISDTYIEEYNWDDVGEWADDILSGAMKAVGMKTTNESEKTWGNATYKYIDVFTHYKSILYASNFTGHFTARNWKWEVAKANDLQFIFKDRNGQQCVLKLETSGNVKKVHAMDIDEWKDYEASGWKDNVYTATDYYDRTKYTIGVPEKIVVTLSRGGSNVVKTTVNINLGSITNEEFDISKNSISLSAVVELNNGYKWEASQVTYSGNNNASAQFTMSKNGKALVTAAVASDLSGIPACNISAFSPSDFDMDDYNTDKVNAKNAYVKLDILGKMQIQGTISDVRKFVTYIDDAEENDDKEAQFKSYVNQANGLADVNLFYDGTSVKQATVKMESFVDDSWNGQTWWMIEPVLNFYDGSSYCTFEAFFNEKDFKETIDAFEKLIEDYDGLFDREER